MSQHKIYTHLKFKLNNFQFSNVLSFISRFQMRNSIYLSVRKFNVPVFLQMEFTFAADLFQSITIYCCCCCCCLQKKVSVVQLNDMLCQKKLSSAYKIQLSRYFWQVFVDIGLLRCAVGIAIRHIYQLSKHE